jgi:hypothetical protein
VSRLNDIHHILGETIPAKRHKKGGIRNGNSRNGIEVVLSNRLKIPGIWAYYSVCPHFPFKIHLMKLQGNTHQSRDSHMMAVVGILNNQ